MTRSKSIIQNNYCVDRGVDNQHQSTKTTRSRTGYLLIGWVSLGLGFVGAFLPLLPTTIFVLVAAWAFAKGDTRWHQWLLRNPRFGPLIVCWQHHRAMPSKAKRAAFVALALSFGFTAWIFGPLSWATIVAGFCIVGVAVYIAHIPALTAEQEAIVRRQT